MNALPPNPLGYSGPVWKLFNEAPLAGDFATGTPGVVAAEARTPAARSVLRLAVRREGDRAADARFRAYGCPTCIAVGAWIAQWSVGRSFAELAGLRAVDLRKALEIPEDRAHCALLGEDAVKALLAQIVDVRVEGDFQA